MTSSPDDVITASSTVIAAAVTASTGIRRRPQRSASVRTRFVGGG